MMPDVDRDTDPEPNADRRLAEVLDDRFRLEQVLGAGGVGVVYRAFDLQRGDHVALKLLNEQREVLGQAQSRFRREGAALAKLRHPHIVDVYEHGVADGALFISMELLDGWTLDSYLAEHGGTLEPRLAMELLGQLLQALSFAHSKGVLHRDLKPGNVFISPGPDGPILKLLDFGLAKFLLGESADDLQTLTRSGMVLGTPLYMAPEKAAGDRVGPSSDVYSVGCVFYEMLVGAPPFRRDTQTDLMRAHLMAPVPPLPPLSVGRRMLEGLNVLLQRALEKRPEDRYSDAAQMLEALQALQRGRRLRRPRRATTLRDLGLSAAARLLLLAAVIGAAVLLTRAARDQNGDPWAEVPPELQALHGKVFRGEAIDKEDLRDLNSYTRLHEHDPRGYLLLGHGFANKGWRKDAVRRYLRAYDLDPSARNDPRMLDSLLAIAEHDAHTGSAHGAIAHIYGKHAREAVQRKLENTRDREGRQRLERLLAELER